LGEIKQPLSRLTLEGISIGVSLRFASRAIAGLVSYVILVRFISPDDVAILLALSSFLLISLQIASFGFDEAYIRLGTEFYGKSNLNALKCLTILYVKYSMIKLTIGITTLVILDYLCNWIIPIEILIVGFIIIGLRILIRINSLIIRVFMNINLSQTIDNAVFTVVFVGTIIGAIMGSIVAIVYLWALFYAIYASITLILAGKYIKKLPKNMSHHKEFNEIKDMYLNTLYPLIFVSILLTLNGRIDSLFIAVFEPIATLEIVAVYLLVSRTALSLTDTLRPIATTILSSLSYAKARNSKVFKISLGVTLRITFFIFSIILIAIMPASYFIILFLFGATYASGYVILPIFMIVGILTILSALMKMISIVVRRIKLYALALFISLIIRIALYLIPLFVKITSGLEIAILLAYFTLISQIFLFITIAIVFRDILAESMKDLAKIVFTALPFIVINKCILDINIFPGHIIALIIPIIYAILTLRLGCLKNIDFIIARKALPKKFWWLIRIAEKIALITTQEST